MKSDKESWLRKFYGHLICWFLVLNGLLLLSRGDPRRFPAEVAAVGLLVTAGVFLLFTIHQLGKALRMRRYYRKARESYEATKLIEPCEVDERRLSQPAAVNWYGLLKAGYEIRASNYLLKDPQLRLNGQPWVCLTKGDLMIPVFRRKRDRETGRHELYERHYIQLAAYCRLVEANSPGGRSPFAIILDYDSLSGDAVCCNQGRDQKLREYKRRVENTIANKDAVFPPEPPFHSNKCLGCRFNQDNPDTNLHQTYCGAKFGWVPPQEPYNSAGW